MPFTGLIAEIPAILTPVLSLTSCVRSNSVFFAHSDLYASISERFFIEDAYFSTIGCSGAITMNVTPNMVSGLVV